MMGRSSLGFLDYFLAGAVSDYHTAHLYQLLVDHRGLVGWCGGTQRNVSVRTVCGVSAAGICGHHDGLAFHYWSQDSDGITGVQCSKRAMT